MTAASAHPRTSRIISSEVQLRALIGEPALLTRATINIDPDTMPTAGQVHRAILGEAFDAARYDQERAERYRRRIGFH